MFDGNNFVIEICGVDQERAFRSDLDLDKSNLTSSLVMLTPLGPEPCALALDADADADAYADVDAAR